MRSSSACAEPGGPRVTNIAEAPAPTTIVFGTDGWRAQIADDYTFENVRRCADGVARYVVERGEQAKGVVIAYDRRFASEHFAAAAAEVLLAHDIPVALAVARRPDPDELDYEVVERGAAAGIVITASHNPWTDNGFKVKSPTRLRGRPGHPPGHRGPDRRERRRRRSSAGRSPTPRPPAWSSATTRTRATSASSGGRSTSTPSRRPTSHVLVEPMYGAGAGWLPRLLAGGKIRVTEIHQERNPYFGGINPEPIRPNVDEALGMHRGRRLRPGPAARRRRRPGRRGRREGHVHPPAPGHRPAHVLPGRAPRPARAGRRQRQQHVDGRPARRALRDRRPTRRPVGFKYIGPKMIETGAMMGAEESGGFGFGMHLPERDGVYADLLLLDLFLREKAAGRWPVSKAIAHFHEIAGPSFYRRIDVHVDRATIRRASSAGCSSTSSRTPPTELAGQPVVADRSRSTTERRLQVLRRRRLVAARPDVRHRAARAGLHGGDVGGRPRTRCWRPASGWSAARDATRSPDAGPRRVDKPWGHELIWAQTDRYCRQDPRHRDGPAALAPAPRASRTSRSTSCRAGCGSPRGRRRRGPDRGARAGRAAPRRRSAGIHRYEAIERVELIEVSTPELDDVVRLEDDFGREGTQRPLTALRGRRRRARFCGRDRAISGVTGTPGCIVADDDRSHRSEVHRPDAAA